MIKALGPIRRTREIAVGTFLARYCEIVREGRKKGLRSGLGLWLYASYLNRR